MRTCKNCKNYGIGQCSLKHKQISPNASVCLDFKLREDEEDKKSKEDKKDKERE